MISRSGDHPYLSNWLNPNFEVFTSSVYEYLRVFTSSIQWFFSYISSWVHIQVHNITHSQTHTTDIFMKIINLWYLGPPTWKLIFFFRYLPYVWVRCILNFWNLNILMNYMYFHAPMWSKQSGKIPSWWILWE